ncbi:MAG TPA: hypothetical protein VFE78_05550 [Gemmataceae bacterium]|nr:hypothetical protein [Gemmataceae bacterium]
MLLFCELFLMLALLALFCRARPRAFRRLGRGFARLARHRALSVAMVGLLALGGSAGLALLTGWPQPHYTDEFSYLLAGDTYAHGRLSSPSHPLWVHFENFHVIHQPSYASQYPPAQGLFLALGQVLAGRPIVGVWLSLALACMAVCWMLQAWLPPRWALFGALLATVRLVFWGHPFGPDDRLPAYWGQSYLGGAVAALGGALVYGGLRRLVARPRVSSALLLGLGLAVLANSRPYEGLVCSLPAAGLLLVWLLGKRRPAWTVALGRVALPLALVLGTTFAGMAYYNLRVTGSPLKMPYQVHEETYGSTPIFLWQPLRPERPYRHEALAENYRGWYLEEYRRQRTPAGLAFYSCAKLGKVLGFYLGVGLLMPLIALRYAARDRWLRFALVACAVELAGLLLTTGGLPHYVAPMTGLVFVVAVQALRQVRLWRWRGLPAGRAYVRALPAAYLLLLVLSVPLERRGGPADRHVQRAFVLERLSHEPGRHLVLVRYEPKPLGIDHEEWVYNGADIDGAKVVWARAMGPEEDRALLGYFHGRRVWRVNADEVPAELTPDDKGRAQR